MDVLVVGGGGREHALAWAVSRSSRVDQVYAAPGNGGTAAVGTNVDIAATDIDALLTFAKENAIDLTIVGPEAPLTEGIVDRFTHDGLRCYGPTRRAAELEGSKAFAKDFMKRHNIPTAHFAAFSDVRLATEYIKDQPTPMVVKADGLAAGKGVYVAETTAAALRAVYDIMVDRRFGDAGGRLIVEEFLEGEEVSVHAVCAGGDCVLLPASQDHKRAHDGDQGPNTGGMGAYAPVPSFTSSDMDIVRQTVIEPTLAGLASEGIEFTGTLYAGLMRTADGPKVLEFNVRFGDPETEVILPLIKSDVFELLYEAAGGKLPEDVSIWDDRSAATIVMAAGGYPGSYQKGYAINGLEDAVSDNLVPFHAGTGHDDGELVTTGGRVLAVTAWNEDLRGALSAAYAGVERIQFVGAFWRKDIGHRAL